MAIQAMVGLNPRKREAMRKHVERLCLEYPTAEHFIKRVCVRIGIALAEEKPAFTLFAVRTLVEDMAKTTDAEQLKTLAGALQAVPGQLPVAAAQQAYTAILAAMAKTTDAEQLKTLAGALQAVPGQLERQKLIDLLKWPVSIEAFRAFPLGMLEQQLGHTFHGNLWEMVAWAKKHNLDVEHPPPNPKNN
jgi:hypothetical protein